jgi:hypothetical protein
MRMLSEQGSDPNRLRFLACPPVVQIEGGAVRISFQAECPLSTQIFDRINKIHKIQEETKQGIAPLFHLVNLVNPVGT